MKSVVFTCVVTITASFSAPNIVWGQMYFNGPGFYRGSTVAGDYWRGGGTYWYGRGALEAGRGLHLEGAGKYLDSLGRYQIETEQAREMSMKNQYSYEQYLRRSKQEQRELKEQAKRARDAKEHEEQLAKFIQNPDREQLVSGAALNFAFERLGSSVVAREVPISSQVTREELEKVRLQTRGGLHYGANQTIATDGTVIWPKFFQAPQFERNRAEIEVDVQALVASLSYGIPADTLKVNQVDRKLGEFFGAIRESVSRQFEDWVEIHRFEKLFRRHLKLLATAEGLHWRDGGLECRAGNLAELLDHMYRNNLRFAPTDDAGLKLYVRIHRTLVRLNEGRGAIETMQVALSD